MKSSVADIMAIETFNLQINRKILDTDTSYSLLSITWNYFQDVWGRRNAVFLILI